MNNKLIKASLAIASYLVICNPCYSQTGETTAITLTIHSATDTEAIAPVINAFEAANPGINVDYIEFQSSQLYQNFRESFKTQQNTADLIISSAMDLQTRLVNDGYALAHNSSYTKQLPTWANWRNEAFGFSFEPVVVVYNKAAFTELIPPESREQMAQQLRENPEMFANRVGSYDIRISGVGYLFSTQDSIRSSISGRLLESLARAEVRTYCCTQDILDAIVTGELILGYNLLGSYSLAKAANDSRIGILMLKDYTLVMSRVAFISKKARQVSAAKSFIDFLLSLAGQQVIANQSKLIAIHPGVTAAMSASSIRQEPKVRFEPIPLGPELLVYLDQMKRQRFLSAWVNTLGAAIKD